MSYQLPKTKITVSGDSLQLHKPLTFHSNPVVDKSSKPQSYLWYLDNSVYSNQKDPVYAYNQGDFLNYVFLQVQDSNGFLADAAITVDGTGQELAFTNLDPNDTTVIVVPKDAKTSKTVFQPVYIEIGIIVLIMLAMVIALIRKAKQSKR